MTARYRLRDDIRLTELEDEGVVLHLGSREYFTVSETGLVILRALDGAKTLAQLTEAVVAEYDVPQDQATESVKGFLSHCLTEGLITRLDVE